MKKFLTNIPWDRLVIALLIVIILIMWYNRNSYRSEHRRTDRVIKDSLGTLQRSFDLLKIEDAKKARTIEVLMAEKKELEIKSIKSKIVKTQVFNEPKKVVPDSILRLYKIVEERIAQDSFKIKALETYVVDLENELFKDNEIINYQNDALVIRNRMLEAKDLMATQMDARYYNDQNRIKDLKRKNRKLILTNILTGAAVVGIAIIAL